MEKWKYKIKNYKNKKKILRHFIYLFLLAAFY